MKRFRKLSGLAVAAVIVLPLILQPAVTYGTNGNSPFQKITHSLYCSLAGLFNPAACEATDEQLPPIAVDKSGMLAAPVSASLPLRATDTELPEQNEQSARQIIQPVVERTVHTREIVRESGITQDQFDAALNNLRRQIASAQAVLPASYGAPVARSIPNTWGLTQRIDNLDGVDFSNGTITGTPITNSPISGSSGSFTDFLATNATSTNLYATTLTALSGLFTNATTTDFVATGTSSLSTLTVSGNTSFTGTLGVTGTTTLATTTLSSALYDASGSAGTSGHVLTSTGTSTAWSTIGGSSITADSLDWSEFADAMTLDTSTAIDMDTNGADLNFDSNTLVIDSSTDRVGIGTTNPGAALHIVDTHAYLRTVATGQSAGVDFGQTSDGAGQINVRANNHLSISTNNSERVRIDSSGNVGIRTTAPGVKLEISSSSGGASLLQLSNTEAGYNNSYTMGITTAKVLEISGGGSAGDRVSIGGLQIPVTSNPLSGNIGIGDTTPAAALTVGSGDLFQVNSSGAIAAATGITSSGTINFSGLTASCLIATDASKNLSSTITEANLESSISDASNIFTNNDTITTANIADSYLLNTGDTATGDYNFDSDTLVIDSANDRVGIGVANPSGALDVSGYWGANFTSNYGVTRLNGSSELVTGSGLPNSFLQYLTSNGNIAAADRNSYSAWFAGGGGHANFPTQTVMGSPSIYARMRIDSDTFSASSAQTISTAASLYIGSAPQNGTNVSITNPFALYVNSGNSYFSDNVGIGTKVPWQKLSVKAGSSEETIASFGNSSTQGRVDLGLTGWHGRADIYNASNTKTVSLNSAGDSYLTGGNVGIGTVSPGYKLDVYGGQARFRQPSNATTTIFLQHGNDNSPDLKYGEIRNRIDGTDGSSAIRLGQTNVESSYVSLIANNSEVLRATSDKIGIGTTNPQDKLHIDASNGSNGISFMRPTDDATMRVLSAPDYSTLKLGGGNQSHVDIYAHTTQIARFTNGAGGRVGIGTTSPVDKLDVAGDIRVGTGTTGCVKDADGTTIAGTCSSDERLKTDITDLPDILDNLVELQPVSYHWNETAADLFSYGTSSEQIGLIAQQVEAHLPALVTEDAGGYKQIRFSDLPIYLLKGMREMWAVVTGNRDDIAALKNEVAALKAQLTASGVSQPVADNDNSLAPEPTIELRGNDPAQVALNATYSDLGVIAKDANGNDLSVSLRLDGEHVEDISLDTSTSTTHIITYSATTQDDTALEITRTVIIGEPEETETGDTGAAEPEATEAEDATDETETVEDVDTGTEENPAPQDDGHEEVQEPEVPANESASTNDENEPATDEATGS